jgi:hypothetical protein
VGTPTPYANTVRAGDAGPYARFKRALKTGNLHLVRTAAPELDGPLQLDDALEVLALRTGGPGAVRVGRRAMAGAGSARAPTVELSDLALLLAALSSPDEGLVARVRRAL